MSKRQIGWSACHAFKQFYLLTLLEYKQFISNMKVNVVKKLLDKKRKTYNINNRSALKKMYL